MQEYCVCVVDDCVEENQLLCDGLQLHGYEIEAAYTGEQALEQCGAGRIDLLLLDIGLPDIDGYEVCRRLKANPDTAHIDVIFATAKDEAQDIEKGFDLGAVDYIVKPYNLPFVMIRVNSAMRTKQTTDIYSAISDVVQDAAYTDQLTGLRNRRFLLERLNEEIEKAHRHDYPVSCLFFDLSDIEALDKELGTASLDDLLTEIAYAMRDASRNYDILARFEGGLFAAVLPHAAVKDAVCYAKKLQDEVQSATLCEPSFPTQAKLSCGIVTCRNGTAKGADHILSQALRNLLHANARNADSRIVARDMAEDGEKPQ